MHLGDFFIGRVVQLSSPMISVLAEELEYIYIA